MSRLVVETATDRLAFDAASGRLLSVRHAAIPSRELVASRASDPVVAVGYLDGARTFRSAESTQAEVVTVGLVEGGRDWSLTIEAVGLGGLALDATVSVRGGRDDRWSHWSLALHDRTAEGLRIANVAFPYVALPRRVAGRGGGTAIIRPFGAGQLLRGPSLDELEPDAPAAFELRPDSFDCLHYPGYTFAQFLAASEGGPGLFLACLDVAGRPKVFKPLAASDDRIRLGVAHLGDWADARDSPRTLEYEVVLGGFTGDWEDAALLYREWALDQAWAKPPLAQRTDIPAWLLDSPMPMVVRAAGVVDDGPSDANPAFVPYERLVEPLDRLAEATDGPVMPILMAWERGGPWVYPEALPPVGGSASFAAFTAAARARGWPVGTFCDGTRWVVGHRFSGYDGAAHFQAAGGPGSITRTHTGEPWQENWDTTWRPSHPACLAVPRTREIAKAYVASLVGELGLDMVQFFDQNLGGSTFPCYAEDHPHPSVPGPWMTEAMTTFMAELRATAAGAVAGSDRAVAISVESAPAEVHLGSVGLCDIRAVVDGHAASDPLWDGAIPLFHFLYHEVLPIQGGFGWAPEPHHVALRNAWNLVIGELPGGVLTPDGRLLDRDTVNWAPWDEPVEDPADGLAVLRSGLAMRRGPGRAFLVFGRMEKTARVRGIATRRWRHGDRAHAIPSVFHRTWRAPDGRLGLALANWTDRPHRVVVDDARFAAGGEWIASGSLGQEAPVPPGPVSLRLAPHSAGLLVAAGPARRSRARTQRPVAPALSPGAPPRGDVPPGNRFAMNASWTDPQTAVHDRLGDAPRGTHAKSVPRRPAAPPAAAVGPADPQIR